MAEFNVVVMEGGAVGKDARYAQPTLRLRFLSGTLQQLWLIVQYGVMNQETSRSTEWRDVPVEDAQ